jgi:hypothetical protein
MCVRFPLKGFENVFPVATDSLSDESLQYKSILNQSFSHTPYNMFSY